MVQRQYGGPNQKGRKYLFSTPFEKDLILGIIRDTIEIAI